METNTPSQKSQEDNDEDELINQISNLSAEARQRVLRRVGACDLGKYLGATIRVSDWGKFEAKPRAAYIFYDGSEDSIDIFEALRETPLSITDPRILMAVHRWLHIDCYHKVLPKWYKTGPIDFGKIARENLKKIGDSFKSEPLSANLREEVMQALVPDMVELSIILHIAWERLYSNEVQYLSYCDEDGEPLKRESTNIEKLQKLKDALEEGLKEIGLKDSPAVRLQISIAYEDLLRARLMYRLERIDKVDVKLGEDTASLVSVEFSIKYEPSVCNWSVLLHDEKGGKQWVSVGVLIKQSGIRVSEGEHLCLRDLITDAGYSIPSFELSEHELRLAALAGIPEPFWVKTQRSQDNPNKIIQMIGDKNIPLDDVPSHLTKTKLEMIFDFLSEQDDMFLSRRPNRPTFQSRFFNWLFDVEKDAAKKSRKRAKELYIGKRSNASFGSMVVSGNQGLLVLNRIRISIKASENRLSLFELIHPSGFGFTQPSRYYPPSWLNTKFLLPDVLNEYSFSDILVEIPILQNLVKG